MEFFDSVNPENIPAGSAACLYGDGLYAATAAQAARFSAVRWITVLGSPACGCADFEAGNEVYSNPGALLAWAEGRKAMGCRARVYTDLSNYGEAKSRVAGLPNVVWWLATLDGNKLSADYVADLWAVQFAGGMTAAYDTSWLWGTW